MSHPIRHGLGIVAVGAAAATAGYLGLVTGSCPADLRVGRRTRRLGPQFVDIAGPRDVVFDVIAAPYLGRTPRAMAGKLSVLERGSDMVLAAHYTPVHRWLRATTVETVRFSRPQRIDFRLVRGPVPHVVESFLLDERDRVTTLTYEGELGADLWRLGEWWAGLVAERWERAVAETLQSVKAEAERRAAAR